MEPAWFKWSLYLIMWHNFKSKWWTVRWEEKSEARVMVICWLDTLAPLLAVATLLPCMYPYLLLIGSHQGELCIKNKSPWWPPFNSCREFGCYGSLKRIISRALSTWCYQLQWYCPGVGVTGIQWNMCFQCSVPWCNVKWTLQLQCVFKHFPCRYKISVISKFFL